MKALSEMGKTEAITCDVADWESVTQAVAMIGWLVNQKNSFTTAAVFDFSEGRATY